MTNAAHDDMRPDMPAAPICPRCETGSGLPLFWGRPSDHAVLASQQGLIALGGCMIDHAYLNQQCTGCGYRWEAKDPPPIDWSRVQYPPEPTRFMAWVRTSYIYVTWHRLRMFWLENR